MSQRDDISRTNVSKNLKKKKGNKTAVIATVKSNFLH